MTLPALAPWLAANPQYVIEQHTPILSRLLEVLLPAEAVGTREKTFERCFGMRYDVPLADLAAPVALLAGLPWTNLRCVIVENKTVFLTLPPIPHTIAIFGSGFQIELLRELPWLTTCPIWYWGDLDAQGFQILARLRALFPQVVSLMMDAAAFEAFRKFAVAGTPCSLAELPQLTPDEQAMYANLVRSNLRLEQERISYMYAVQHMHESLGTG